MALSAGTMETGGPNSEMAQRMQLLRYLKEGDDRGAQARFAEWLKITYTRWNNIERGFPVSKDLTQKLVQKFPGLDWGWVQSGSEAGLTGAMAERLAEAKRRRGTA